MTDLNGLELARSLNQVFVTPPLQKILMVTGGDKIDTSVLKDSGICSVIYKPILRKQVFQSLILIRDELFEKTSPKSNYRQTGFLDHNLESQVFHETSIILVEDNMINQEVAKTILQKKGFLVDIAANGMEAIESLGRKEYDLILMDLQMPIMDGLEATSIIRSDSDRRIRNIPIIAMTANAMSGDQEKCIIAGMNDYISKPFDPYELIEKAIYWSRYSKSKNYGSVINTDVSELLHSGKDDAFGELLIDKNEVHDQDLSMIQLDQLIARLMGDKELAYQLLKKANVTMGIELSNIENMIKSRDLEQLGKLTHKLKGSFGNLSVEILRKGFEDIEIAVKVSDWERITNLHEILLINANKFTSEIMGIISKAHGGDNG